MVKEKPFRNRVWELGELNHLVKLAKTQAAQMLVLYGRRRIGKTSLLLRERSTKLTKLKEFTPSYALFSKSGFAADLKRNLPEDTRLFQGGAFREG